MLPMLEYYIHFYKQCMTTKNFWQLLEKFLIEIRLKSSYVCIVTYNILYIILRATLKKVD